MSDAAAQCALISQPTLFVVATPIGNLNDITPRARQVLAQVHRVAAEDTRNTGRLLEKLGIKQSLVAHHAHNEADSVKGLLRCLEQGESIALVSDAGTPAVSDPGAALVYAAAQAGFDVVPVPGASSVLAAVAASGLVQGPFTFRGFLPSKGASRIETLQAWLKHPEPQVIFEAPHRILGLIDELNRQCEPGRVLCAGREMTKQHETFYRGTVAQVQTCVQQDPYSEKGEWVLVIEGKTQGARGQGQETDGFDLAAVPCDLKALAETLLPHTTPKTVVQCLVQASGLPKSTIYPMVMAVKDGQ